MIPNYGIYPQQMQRLNYLEQQATILKGRPVASIEEVRATPIDFDGSIFYFPDQANNRIYSKQIGLNGQSILKMYELVELPTTQINSDVKYVTYEEFNQALNQLSAQLNKIKQGGEENDKSKQQQPSEYSF